jgi:glutathionylspermidine synthase
MNAPWREVQPLPAQTVACVRRRAIFDWCKWDPQVEDVSTVADVPIVLGREAWCRLAALAERLSREVLAAEEELAERPELHPALGLPRTLAKALGRAHWRRTAEAARIIRFDFHHTTDGWKISEANTDVPGGMNEASGLGALMSPHYPGTVPAGDTVAQYVRAIVGQLPPAARVALAHATAYTDDRQVMSCIAGQLTAAGARPCLVSPAHVRWREGRAFLESGWISGPVDAVVRFFPGEWLPNLPAACGWTSYFRGSSTPISNPASALLTQSKRFPLIWPRLGTPVQTWRALLPETRDPRELDWRRDEGWVLKPALGRVGEGIGLRGITQAGEWDRIAAAARRRPGEWVVQRRFTSTPLTVRGSELHPSIGVYTIDGRVAGAYGRLAQRPLIDWLARDAAVLVDVQ